MKKIYLLVIMVACLTSEAQMEYPEVRIEARVTDETGLAISNAPASAWFRKLKTNNPFEGQESTWSKGVTDEKGIFIASSQTLGLCGVGAEKEGYYVSRKEIRLGKHKEGKWIPWHQVVELKLRKKGSPIPMYAKKLESLILPVVASPVGYDLMAGDWVSPHGKGLISDIEFTLQREIRGNFDFDWQLTAKLPGEGNGLSAILPSELAPESELHFPRSAPADGYAINDVVLGYKYSKSGIWETNSTSSTNFFFRVRAEYDENKHLRDALYGKLLGPIKVRVQGTKTAKLYFTYYLNPTSLDRNMEFEPKKNLFNILRFEEEVRDP